MWEGGIVLILLCPTLRELRPGVHYRWTTLGLDLAPLPLTDESFEPLDVITLPVYLWSAIKLAGAFSLVLLIVD